jgi:ElaB/YqjD/DUF883 family membrane-anchored ribosome-binding protein
MHASPDKLVRDIRVVVQDAEELIKATSGDIGEKTREARAKLAGALVVAKETLNQAEEAAASTMRQADSLIRQYPYPCLGIAFATGLFLGALILHRSSSL